MWEQRPPRDVALRILRALFGATRGATPPPHRTFALTGYQEEGVRRVRAILRAHGGAILADAVGLGKTYMALALIEERVLAGWDIVVVVPATLRGTWRVPLGAIRRAAGQAGTTTRCRLVSHAQLSRGVAIAAATGPRLVVVDEAHRFRNPATLRYGALAHLVGGGASAPARTELLLITATPVNNTVADLYHLARLFLPDDGLRRAGLPSLRAAFQGDGGSSAGPTVLHAPDGPPGIDAVGIGTVVRELVVRRTRRAADEGPGGIGSPGGRVRFPHRATPCIVRYAAPGLTGRVRRIAGLELRAYGEGAAPLLRLGLLKRMDSGALAFERSVRRLGMALEAFADAAEAGRLLRPGRGAGSGDDDPLQLVLLDVVAENAPPDLDLEALAASARRDIRRLDGLLQDGGGDRDGKVRALAGLLDRLADEKVVIFTEYRDTAEALWRALGRRFRVGRVDGSGAWLGQQRAGRRVVVERFAPRANNRPAPTERERVDVLVATDVLAEGLDLQDARHVVSFDLPWNPVRLIQRIGRVDRLGSPHDVVVPHLFVPGRGLDALLGLTGRLRAKLDGIAATVGADEADELLAALARGRPDLTARALASLETREADHPWEALRTMWRREVARAPSGRSDAVPAGRGTARDAPANPWVAHVPQPRGEPAADIRAAVLVNTGGRHRLLEVAGAGEVRSGQGGAVALVTAALETRGPPPTVRRPVPRRPAPRASARSDAPGESGWLADVARINRAVMDFLAMEAAAALAPAPLRRNGTGARLARRVKRALAEAGSALDPASLAAADDLLRTLQLPLRPEAETAAATILAWAANTEPEPHRLIGRAVDVLADPGHSQRPRAAASSAAAPRVEAILLARDEPAGGSSKTRKRRVPDPASGPDSPGARPG